MRNIALFSFLSIVLVFTGCKKTYGTNEEFTLKFNESDYMSLNGLKYEVKFAKVVEESRCPPDVECITAGQVIIKIQTEKSSTYTLGLQSSTPPTLEFAGHTIRLLEVNYGKDSNYGKEKRYSIKLRIEE